MVRPCCGQLYNLFHACDPNASRIEPLIQTQFSQIPPCCIPRYSQFPLGDGESTSLGKQSGRLVACSDSSLLFLVEYVHQYSKLFLQSESKSSSSLINTSRSTDGTNLINTDTMFSNRENGHKSQFPLIHLDALLVRQTWWGSRRVDYIVYCPESLMSQPAHVLPIVFHSSYWESRDVMAFILRKVILLTDHDESRSITFCPV